MPSILTSGGGLDGVLMPGSGPFQRLGSMNAGLCTASSPTASIADVKNEIIYTSSEDDISNLYNAVLGRDDLFINLDNNQENLNPPAEYRIGDEIRLGDRNAPERGDLNNITSQKEIIATGWNMNRNGTWTSPTGAIVSTLPTSLGQTVSFGSDNTSGRAVEYYAQYGATDLGDYTISR